MKKLFLTSLFLFFTCLYAYGDTEVVGGGGGGCAEGDDCTFGNMTVIGILRVRQDGGTPGTDEIRLIHNGTNGSLVSESGDTLIGSATATIGFGNKIGVYLGSDLRLDQTGGIGWTSFSNNWKASTDIGLSRDSAGVLKVTDGDSGYGSLKMGSVTFVNMTTIFGDYSAINNMNQILCDATAGDVDIHIVSASGTKGRVGNVKKIDTSGNNCIIEPAGAETIDGVANRYISTQWENLTYFSDNSNLLIR